jgi:hypothetical protein
VACGRLRVEAPFERNIALGVRILTAEATMVPGFCCMIQIEARCAIGKGGK